MNDEQFHRLGQTVFHLQKVLGLASESGEAIHTCMGEDKCQDIYHRIRLHLNGLEEELEYQKKKLNRKQPRFINSEEPKEFIPECRCEGNCTCGI